MKLFFLCLFFTLSLCGLVAVGAQQAGSRDVPPTCNMNCGVFGAMKMKGVCLPANTDSCVAKDMLCKGDNTGVMLCSLGTTDASGIGNNLYSSRSKTTHICVVKVDENAPPTYGKWSLSHDQGSRACYMNSDCAAICNKK